MSRRGSLGEKEKQKVQRKGSFEKDKTRVRRKVSSIYILNVGSFDGGQSAFADCTEYDETPIFSFFTGNIRYGISGTDNIKFRKNCISFQPFDSLITHAKQGITANQGSAYREHMIKERVKFHFS